MSIYIQPYTVIEKQAMAQPMRAPSLVGVMTFAALWAGVIIYLFNSL